jgi:hypothetical protein
MWAEHVALITCTTKLTWMRRSCRLHNKVGCELTVVIYNSQVARNYAEESKVSYIAIEHAFVIQDTGGANLRFNRSRLFSQRRRVVTKPYD